MSYSHSVTFHTNVNVQFIKLKLTPFAPYDTVCHFEIVFPAKGWVTSSRKADMSKSAHMCTWKVTIEVERSAVCTHVAGGRAKGYYISATYSQR